LATPARQPLHPASPKAWYAPPDLFDPTFANQPNHPVLCHLLPTEGCSARPSGCLAFLRVTVDFFKIQRSAWRAQETEREAAVRSPRRGERPTDELRSKSLRVLRCVCTQPVDRFCVVVFCVRDIGILENRERGSSRLMTPGLGCHAFFMVASERSGTDHRGEESGVRVNRDIYFASSPPPWLRPFSHLLRRQFRRTCRVRARLHTSTMHITRIRSATRASTAAAA